MRKRLYYLLPDKASARRTMSDLLMAHVAERHIHFVARDGMDLSGLHEANLLQTSDIVHGAQSGLVIGGVSGLAASLVATFAVMSGTGLPLGAVVLGSTLASALIGAWAASMVACSVPNSRLEQFRAAMEQGQILLMVDVQRWRVEEIETLVQRLDPQAHLEGVEPTIPAFP
ncbi:DUF1269 domain-containing protein [Chitinimonas sp.]|uniref:DUF1269 domain-containing protein n=1 Tax=Chitinimonas sp. TaxID=1934313 RepID=UPI002F920AE6